MRWFRFGWTRKERAIIVPISFSFFILLNNSSGILVMDRILILLDESTTSTEALCRADEPLGIVRE